MKTTQTRARRCGFFALLATLVLTGCTTGTPDLRPSLRVGIAPSYPPVLFEQEGEIVGIEADLARIMAEEIGRRLVFHRYSFPELLDALEHGEVDLAMGGLSITPERSRRVRFTEPYLQVGQLAVIRAQDIARLGRVRWIKRRGTKVGYERGTSGEDYVANRLPRSAAFAFDSVAEGIRSLRAGRIEYFIHDSPTIWRLAGDPAHRDLIGLYRPLTEEHLAWAVRRDDTTLHALLDSTISHWKREGLIEPILNRWIPFRVRIH
ncbi:MAG: transporter substrate-binding domain-containing protein [Deltaproteobacteria bacterium]|nr:transporter substrate-binding domain-containing protein [Deltaproteobacteria bacterium]